MPGPAPLTMKRWFRLYLPLSLTFLLMSGSSPIVNKGIGSLPDETIGLAAFVNAFSIFDDVARRNAMGLSDALLPRVKHAILAFLPIPVLVTIRGVHQGAHITNDTPTWVGIGTACRFAMLIAFVFLVGVPLRIEGAVMGGLAFSVGIATETAVVTLTARRSAHFLGRDHPSQPPPELAEIWRFVGPLFLANAMGVFLQPLTNAIVNSAVLTETSSAAFGVVRSFTWFFCSTLFALQALALAKADSVANLRRLLVYSLIPVGLFTGLIFLVLAIPGARRVLLEGFFEIDPGRTIEFVREALTFTLVLPTIMALRSAARGLLMRGGRTGLVTTASLVALGALLAVKLAGPATTMENGAVAGYVAWIGALTLELVILAFAVARAGITHCVTEGGRSSALPEDALLAAAVDSATARRPRS